MNITALIKSSIFVTLLASAPLCYSVEVVQDEGKAQAVIKQMLELKENHPNTPVEEFVKLLEQAAAFGDVKAQFELTHYYYHTKYDYKMAFEWCEQAAGQNYVPAVSFLAMMYEKGTYVKADISKAAKLYRQAADGGYALAALCYVDMVMSSQCDAPDEADFVRYVELATEEGGDKYYLILASCYLGGVGGEADSSAAMDIYVELAKKGNAEAMYMMGCVMLERGKSDRVKQDSIGCFEKSAERGNVKACEKLADLYEEGQIVTKDSAKAKYYRDFAQQDAKWMEMTDLATRYFEGDGVERDTSKAAELLHTAAAGGYARAQIFLSMLYYSGYGVEKDTQQSLYWMKKAADQGDSEAIDMLQKLQDAQR